jgi:hypothetical protein
MVESHDELLMEIARAIGLGHMGEDEDDEEDANDVGDATAPLLPRHHLLHHLLPRLRRSTKMALWR